MAFSWTVTKGMNDGGANVITSTLTFSGSGAAEIDETFSTGNDQAVVFSLDVSQVKAFFLLSTLAATIETNSSSAAANTFTLVADVPFVWTNQDGPAWRDTAGTAVTSDITVIYVSVAGSARVRLFALYDSTV